MDTMVDIRQQELDMFEQQLLTDMFGGYTPDKFVFKMGFFKYDFSDKVQGFIRDMESTLKPVMNDNGEIRPSDFQKYLNTNIINLPNEYKRPVELYRYIQPFVRGLKDFITKR